MRLPSASKLELARACVYPWTSGIRWPADVGSAHAQLGRAVHKSAEICALGLPLVAEGIGLSVAEAWETACALIVHAYGLAAVDSRRFRAMAEHIREDVHDLAADAAASGGELVPERRLAYSPRLDRTRQLGGNSDRDYSGARAGEFFGQLDLVRPDAGVIVVSDYKTGAAARRSRARESLQLGFLGLAAARSYGAERVAVELRHVDEDGIRVDRVELSAFDLDATAGFLLDLEARLLAAASPPVPGPHCRDLYCPLPAVCPALNPVLAAVDKDGSLALPFSPEIQSPEHAASVRRRLPLAKEALRQIEDAVQRYTAEHGAVEVAPGLFYGPVRHDGREQIDLSAAGALSAIREVLGEYADAAVEVDASKASLERGVRARLAAQHGEKAPRGAKVGLERALLGKLRDLGAIKQGAPYTKFEEFKKEIGQ